MNDQRANPGAEPDDAALRRVAASLGSRAAERLDADAIGRVVVERLRTPGVVPLRRRSTGVQVWLRIAATVLVLAGGGVVARQLVRSPKQAPRLMADELTDLGADELKELLSTLDQTLAGTATPPGAGLEELDAEQLERVLGAIGG